MEVRSRIYELLTHCIPPDMIFFGLTNELVKKCDDELKTQVIEFPTKYEVKGDD